MSDLAVGIVVAVVVLALGIAAWILAAYLVGLVASALSR